MRHLMIPDLQVKPWIDMTHIRAIGNYIVEKKPDVVVNIGDHADMPSLSAWDKKGSFSMEGRRYKDDVEAAVEANRVLWQPLADYNDRQRANRKARYLPRRILTMGNHEHRIIRAVEADPRLLGTIGLEDLQYDRYYDEVYPYLQPVEVDGIWYSHVFVNQLTGRAIGGNAHYKLAKLGFSFTQGHVQVLDTAIKTLQNGKTIRGLVCGAAYTHDESYKGPQGNGHFRGIILKNEVEDGNYDLCEVSLNFLLKHYA